MRESARLAPPPTFEGTLRTDATVRRSHGRASGPYRLEPAAVAEPTSTRDVQALIAWATEESLSLVPRGAGTGMPGGNVGRGVSLDLSSGFAGIGGVDRDRRRISVGAGAVAGEIDGKAREAGLFLPALPSSSDRCTIGGMAANDAAGSRSFRYGSIREWIDSLDVVLADGRAVTLSRDEGSAPPPFESLRSSLADRWPEIEETWPAVRKNSSGYALDRFLPDGPALDLIIGSEGTLGVITGATLELAPVPPASAVVLLSAAGPDELLAIVDGARTVGASACEFFGRRFIELSGLDQDPRVGELADGAYALLMMELEGSDSEVAELLARVEGLARAVGSPLLSARDPVEREELWAVRHATSPTIARAADEGRISMQFIEDSVVPPRRLAHYLDGLDAILYSHETDAVVFGHAGDANIHVNPLVDVTRADWKERVRGILDETVDLVARLGGTLTGEHGDGRVRAPYLERIYDADAVSAFTTVKETLDPAGILNPGVILPLEGQDPLEGMSGHR